MTQEQEFKTAISTNIDGDNGETLDELFDSLRKTYNSEVERLLSRVPNAKIYNVEIEAEPGDENSASTRLYIYYSRPKTQEELAAEAARMKSNAEWEAKNLISKLEANPEMLKQVLTKFKGVDA